MLQQNMHNLGCVSSKLGPGTVFKMNFSSLWCMQSCKNVSLVPQGQFLVRMWFLKICGIFCLNVLSNWSNRWYIFLLSKIMDLLSAILHMLPIFASRLLIRVVVNRVAFYGAGGPSDRRKVFRRQLLTKFRKLLCKPRMLWYVCSGHQS